MGGYSSKSSGSPGGGGTKEQAKNFAKKNRKSIATKVKEGVGASIKARRKTAYNVANVIPGMEKGLKRNRQDYKSYLADRGVKPDFLNVDDKTLTSFDTYEKLIAYKPTQAKPRTSVLNYADYLAEEKQNYNLKYSGNVGNRGNGAANIQINKPILGSGSNIQKTAVKKAPAGPTIAELEQTEQQRLLNIKRRGRKTTKLASLDDELTLSKKILLG